MADRCFRCGSPRMYLMRRCEKHFHQDYDHRFRAAWLAGSDTRLGRDKRRNAGPGKTSGVTIAELVSFLEANGPSTIDEVCRGMQMTTNQARYRLKKGSTGGLTAYSRKDNTWRAT